MGSKRRGRFWPAFWIFSFFLVWLLAAGVLSLTSEGNPGQKLFTAEGREMVLETGVFFLWTAVFAVGGQKGRIPERVSGAGILAGILAATMSTADSQLLAASSSVSQNLFVEFFGGKFTSKQGMIVARGTMIVVSLVAMFLARDPDSSVFRVVSFAWAGFGASFGPVVLFALFWKRSNKWGALAGMISGGAMVFIWKYLIAPMGGVFAIYELLPAFLVSSIVIVAVSLATEKPDAETERLFDEVKTM